MSLKVSDWKVERFGDVCDFVRGPFGGSLKKQIFVNDGYAVYEQQHAIYDQFTDIRYFVKKDKFEEMKRFEIHPGNLIMSCSGTMGKVAIVPEGIKKGIINQALLLLKPSKKVLNKFIKLWMESENFQDSLKAYSQGAAIQNVASVKILKEIPIPIPPLPEQQRIVSLLDEAFESIAGAKVNAERNLVNARELYESILEEVFTNSGNDWKDMALESLCSQITVGHVGSMASKYKPSGIPFLRSQNILPNEISLDNVVYIDKHFNAELKKSQLRPGDVVIVRTGYPGTSAVIPKELPESNCSDLVIARPEKLIDPYYLCLFFNSTYGKKLVLGNLVGAAQKHFNVTTAKGVLIPVPPLAEQRAIVARLDVLSAETKKLEGIYEQKIAALEELKKSVLARAFEGEM